jgi:tetratricopeptide (TPR) repeat protein
MKIAAQLEEAATLERLGDIDGAIACYRKVLKREPSNIDALFLLGRAHCQQGDLQAGGELFRKIVKLRPQHAPAQTLLGRVLAQSGHPREAIPCYDRALAADPGFAMALVNKADALVALVRDAEAVTNFERAIPLMPGLAQVHFGLANALQRLGRFEDAVSHYQRAIALKADVPDVYSNLGRALGALGRWQEALPHVQQATRLAPNAANVHHAMGFILWNLERDQDALASFDKALSLDPRHVEAATARGVLLHELGRLEESRAQLARVIAISPSKTAAYLHLSEAKRFAPGDAEIAAMEGLLPRVANQPLQEQVDLHFALAKAYGDIGECPRAFQHLKQGNALKRRGIDYDEAATLESYEHIAQTFTAGLIAEKAKHGDPSQRPIFIVGMPRSGSTLIEQILASHPRVHGAGERKDFREAIIAVDKEQYEKYPDLVSTLTPGQLQAIASHYLASMGAGAGDADRFVDKMLGNFVYVGLIHMALPRARIIHARRDPMDTCLSCFSKHFRTSQKFAYDLGELGRFYRAYDTLMAHWRNALPAGVMLDVQYEDMVADLEGQTRRMLDTCGLEWDDACLAFHETQRPVRTASAVQVREPIYKSAVGRWRAYEEELGPLIEALGIEPSS